MLLRLIDDVTDQLNVRQKPGLLLTVGYCQAFDRISKDFMIQTFKKFGFGPDFVKWVLVFLWQTQKPCCLLRLVIRVFCRRGWNPSGLPFFTIAFVLAVELLAINIRHCENIKGLNYWKAKNGLLFLHKFFSHWRQILVFLFESEKSCF